MDWMDLNSMLNTFRRYPKPTPTLHSQRNVKWIVGLHLNSAGDLGECSVVHAPNFLSYVATLRAITEKITRVFESANDAINCHFTTTLSVFNFLEGLGCGFYKYKQTITRAQATYLIACYHQVNVDS